MVAVVAPAPEVIFYDAEYKRLYLRCEDVPCVGNVIDKYEVVGTRRNSGAQFLGRPIVYVYVNKCGALT